MKIKQILVPLRVVQGARAVIRKAALIARNTGARIEIFHAIDEPLLVDFSRREPYGAALQRRGDEVVNTWQKRLDKLLSDPALQGLRVTATAAWDYPPHEAVIRRVNTIGADLVVATTQSHHPGARLFLANTDWELIRQCPTPVLLVKSQRMYEHPTIIAAVDPLHANAKPAALDLNILQTASSLARVLEGEAHAFHAYMPLVAIAPMSVSQPLAFNLPPEAEETHGTQVKQAFEALARKAQLPSQRQHLHRGDVPTQLRDAIRKLSAGIVVMGAVSRSGLRRVFIGSTAERLLDQLTCDVLIVKPASFRSAVRGKTPGAPKKTSRTSRKKGKARSAG